MILKEPHRKLRDGMPIMKQPFEYGHCSLYALANMFNDDRYAREANNDNHSMSIKEQNEVISRLHPGIKLRKVAGVDAKYGDIYLDTPTVVKIIYQILPNEWVHERAYGKNSIIVPYILTILPWDGIDYHAITIFREDNDVYVIDSLFDTATKVGSTKQALLDWFSMHTQKVCYVDRPYHPDTESWVSFSDIKRTS